MAGGVKQRKRWINRVGLADGEQFRRFFCKRCRRLVSSIIKEFKGMLEARLDFRVLLIIDRGLTHYAALIRKMSWDGITMNVFIKVIFCVLS